MVQQYVGSCLSQYHIHSNFTTTVYLKNTEICLSSVFLLSWHIPQNYILNLTTMLIYYNIRQYM